MSPTSIPGTVFSTSQDEFLETYKAIISSQGSFLSLRSKLQRAAKTKSPHLATRLDEPVWITQATLGLFYDEVILSLSLSVAEGGRKLRWVIFI